MGKTLEYVRLFEEFVQETKEKELLEQLNEASDNFETAPITVDGAPAPAFIKEIEKEVEANKEVVVDITDEAKAKKKEEEDAAAIKAAEEAAAKLEAEKPEGTASAE